MPDTVDEAAIRDADIAWSRTGETRDLEALVSYYTADVIILLPNMPSVVGKEAAHGTQLRQLPFDSETVSNGIPRFIDVGRGGMRLTLYNSTVKLHPSRSGFLE